MIWGVRRYNFQEVKSYNMHEFTICGIYIETIWMVVYYKAYKGCDASDNRRGEA